MNLSQPLAHLLADLTVILHLLFIVFVLLGALLLLKWHKLIWLHLPCLFWGVMVELMGWYCPLTPMENYFRQQAGLEMYAGDFVMQYIMPIIYPPDLTREFQLLFGITVLLMNIGIYSYLFWRSRCKAHPGN